MMLGHLMTLGLLCSVCFAAGTWTWTNGDGAPTSISPSPRTYSYSWQDPAGLYGYIYGGALTVPSITVSLTGEFWRLDLQTQQWAFLSNHSGAVQLAAPGGRYGGISVLESATKVHLIGGKVDIGLTIGSPLPGAWTLDYTSPSSPTWTASSLGPWQPDSQAAPSNVSGVPVGSWMFSNSSNFVVGSLFFAASAQSRSDAKINAGPCGLRPFFVVFGGLGQLAAPSPMLWAATSDLACVCYLGSNPYANGTTSAAWPSNRQRAMAWLDRWGSKLFLFGGFGVGSSAVDGYLGDTWAYSFANAQWQLLSGPTASRAAGSLSVGLGNFGLPGLFAAEFLPPARAGAVVATDLWQDMPWLVGGETYALVVADTVTLGDVWMFDVQKKKWARFDNGDLPARGLYNVSLPSNGWTPRAGLVAWSPPEYMRAIGSIVTFGGYSRPSLLAPTEASSEVSTYNMFFADSETDVITAMDASPRDATSVRVQVPDTVARLGYDPVARDWTRAAVVGSVARLLNQTVETLSSTDQLKSMVQCGALIASAAPDALDVVNRALLGSMTLRTIGRLVNYTEDDMGFTYGMIDAMLEADASESAGKTVDEATRLAVAQQTLSVMNSALSAFWKTFPFGTEVRYQEDTGSLQCFGLRDSPANMWARSYAVGPSVVSLNNAPPGLPSKLGLRSITYANYPNGRERPHTAVASFTMLDLTNSSNVKPVQLVDVPGGIIIRFDNSIGALSASNVTCASWNVTSLSWSAAGCVPLNVTSAGIFCNCSHATDFSVLVGGEESQTSADGKGGSSGNPAMIALYVVVPTVLVLCACAIVLGIIGIAGIVGYRGRHKIVTLGSR